MLLERKKEKKIERQMAATCLKNLADILKKIVPIQVVPPVNYRSTFRPLTRTRQLRENLQRKISLQVK
jgi:hypothetical protein